MVVVMNSVHRERRSLNRVLYALALITKTARGGNCAALMTAGDGRGSNYDLVSHHMNSTVEECRITIGNSKQKDKWQTTRVATVAVLWLRKQHLI